MDETHGARARNIEALFVENDQGERFRMPFNSLIGTRAMARHISAGGTPTDEFGQHICEMVEEMLTLRPFVHSMRHRTFEDAGTNEMLESAFEYHALLKNTLKKMKGKRGYNEYKETYQPALTETDDFDPDELREKFVKKVFPTKLEAALPIVHKAYNKMKENTNTYAHKFETWASKVAEGTWALPDNEAEVDQLIELLSDELPVGVDAENASNALYDLIGDDSLFDELLALAKDDPEQDVRSVVLAWLENNQPELYQQILSSIGDDSNYPPEQAEGAHGSAMGGVDGIVYEDDYDEDQVESIASAIVRRILNNIGQHKELLMKAGPEGVLNAAKDVASFHVPVEELGSSDISSMVREVYREVGVEYPEMNEGKVKEVSIDLEELTDEEFKAKYGKTKEEMKAALSEGLSGLQKFGAGAALVGALAGNAYLDNQSIENSPQLQKLEQLYQQALDNNDATKANELEDRIENLKARLELGKGEVLDKHGNPVEPTYESVDDIIRLAGL